MPRPLRWCSALLLAVPVPLGAQLSGGADLALSSRYVWHGLTRTTRPSTQGQVYAVLTRGSNLFALGAGTNLEPFKARQGDLSDHGRGEAGFGEVDLWGEGATRFDGGDATVGVTTAFHRPDPNRTGALQRFTTVEIYSRVRMTRLFLSPSLNAHWDVDRVQGLYIEPAISIPLLANPEGAPFWAAYLSARAGFNLGQQPDRHRATQRFYYAGRGLTHVDVGLNFSLRSVTRWQAMDSQVDLHLQFNRDPQVKRHRASGSLSGTTLRAGIILSYPSFSGRSE